jgi:hypothetical protein
LRAEININLNDARQYAILPASAENPWNISSEPMTHPPPFMSTVREMRGRYMTRIENIQDQKGKNKDMKKIVQKWKTENKNKYRTKVVREMMRRDI